MKNTLWILALLQGLAWATIAQTFDKAARQEPSSFGKKISPQGAISTKELVAKMDKHEKVEAKVEGQIESVCQAKGCWAQVKLPDGKLMRVTFKDYAFFIPKDASGKTIVMEGTARVKTVPVAQLQHYAEDAGASKEDIAKITEPQKTLTFEASGVVIE